MLHVYTPHASARHRRDTLTCTHSITGVPTSVTLLQLLLRTYKFPADVSATQTASSLYNGKQNKDTGGSKITHYSPGETSSACAIVKLKLCNQREYDHNTHKSRIITYIKMPSRCKFTHKAPVACIIIMESKQNSSASITTAEIPPSSFVADLVS